MNLVSGTQMHVLTAVFTGIEIILFFVQFYHFLSRPQDKQRLWYLILLGLLINFNVANGLFPDPSWQLNIKIQYMLADGFAYLMGGYIPYYFYKVYRLSQLKFYATWGVVLFLFIPYLIFEVIIYTLNGALTPDREFGVIIPGIYGIVVLIAMLRAIIRKYRLKGSRRNFRCELTVWVAVLPWEVMAVFAFYPAPQWLRILLANLGWLVITLIMITKAIRYARYEYRQYKELSLNGGNTAVFEANCVRFLLTAREIEIVLLLKQGYKYRAIGERLFIAERTVDKHVRNIYEKVGVNNKIALIHKLYDSEATR